MSNRAFLAKTKFDSNGDIRWGWRLGDDYTRIYNDHFEEKELPQVPLELLAKAAKEAMGEESDLLSDLLQHERGISIDGDWHEFDQIAMVLRKGLYGGD